MIELQILSKSSAKNGKKDSVIVSQVVDKKYTYIIKDLSLAK